MIYDAHIEMFGSRQILIEGCRGLLEYRENIIRVALYKKTLTVTGTNLHLENMTEDSITVCGTIDGTIFE